MTIEPILQNNLDFIAWMENYHLLKTVPFKDRLRQDGQSDATIELQELLKKALHHIWNQQLPERNGGFSDNHFSRANCRRSNARKTNLIVAKLSLATDLE